jgi:hypothetical protein
MTRRFVQREELDACAVFADATGDFQNQFSLVDFAQFTEKGAVLDAFQPVIQAGISHFRAHRIVGDIVDEQVAHSLTSPR